MNIYNFIAYDLGKNLGGAYNHCVNLLRDDDWFVFLDHDAMFMQRDWYPYLHKIIKENPQYDMFTCSTNRIGCFWQKVQGVDQENHDIRYHKSIGKQLLDRNFPVVDATNFSCLSGVVIISNKKAWNRARGAKYGFLGVDNDLLERYRDNGMKLGFIPSLYVYHWYRGDGDTSHLED
jgi:GT2 family glycosyltransferase